MHASKTSNTRWSRGLIASCLLLLAHTGICLGAGLHGHDDDPTIYDMDSPILDEAVLDHMNALDQAKARIRADVRGYEARQAANRLQTQVDGLEDRFGGGN